MIFIDFSDGGLVKYENLRNRVKRRILGKNDIRKVVVTYEPESNFHELSENQHYLSDLLK